MRRITVFAILFAAAQPSLWAHRQWMLPSSTVLSKADSWITIDAAVSNELFYFDHVPLRLNNLLVTAPDGAHVPVENASTGKFRSTFDVHLTQPGTYRIASVSDLVFATWTENGQSKTWRGEAAAAPKEIPAGADGLRTSRMSTRVEVFATAGKPDSRALLPTGAGLELAPVTHPNNLVTGEKASFQFLHNGQPAAKLEVTVIPGGIRYRDQLKEQKFVTDAEGKFSVTFAEPGMYWMNASVGAPLRGPGAAGGPGGPRGMTPPGDRASYVATLEVLPQ
jgi:uncharacterized GH25 family protein